MLSGNILVTDALGVAMYANSGIAQRTGFSVAEIIDSKPGSLWGGNMPRAYYDKMWHHIRNKRQSFHGTVTNQTKDGNQYRELLAVAPLQGSAGPVQYLALRPARLEEEQQFLDEWKRLFSRPDIPARTALPWLMRWFPEEGIFGEQGDQRTFADWVESSLIAPLRLRFQQRSDDQLLIKAAQQNSDQFQVLYEKYFSVVRNYFSRHLIGQDDQILDLTQDTFIRAFERLEGYEIRNATYSTYLLRIAHSVLLNTYRRKSMVELSLDISAPDRSIAADMHWVWETPELSARERTVLSAYYREGYSIREISRGLEVSENAAKLLLSRARKKIRPLLSSV
ncbi:MAG: sigma-70 family RNA polymerase sigma factor [Candidatus Moraniibacteriota bacterium]